MRNHEELWNSCLSVIKDNLSEPAYNTWFAPIVALQYENDTFVLQVPSQFFVELLEEKYIDLLRSTIYREVGVGTKLEYRVLIDQSSNASTQIPSSVSGKDKKAGQTEVKTYNGPYHKTIQLPEIDPQLNDSCSFSSLVEGKSNKLAREAGLSIANDPGKAIFNPLFIYGQSGVGKTHLSNAIGLMAKEVSNKRRVLYVSANTFQIQYTDAVLSNSLNDFLNFYQTIDILIVDDIQEFAGKTKTQNTFFHIFNHLQRTGKQLILTSDRSPKMLAGLEERLLTRFKSGLMAEISKPDFELRKGILNNKIYRDGLEISEEVVNYIAEHVVDNVRDLEGVLASLMAHSTLTDTPINIELAEKIVGNIVNTTPRVVSVEKIRDAVCEYYKLSVDAISTKSRKREVVQARQVAMYLSKQMTKNSISSIGSIIGNRNHATVLHACKAVENLIETDKHFQKTIQEIERMI